MAQYTVTHLCGHPETVRLFGPGDQRERRIEFMQRENCPACRAAVALAEDAAAGLPALEGSDAQIAWASEIRTKQLSGAEADLARFAADTAKYPDCVDYQIVTDYSQGRYHEYIEATRTITDSQWWIDNRYWPLISALIKHAIKVEVEEDPELKAHYDATIAYIKANPGKERAE
jgi:hypothetical protein